MSGIFDSYFNSYPEPTHSNDEKAGINKIDLNQLKQHGPVISPYLDLLEKIQKDPSIFQDTQPQYIMPEGTEHGRGKFELSLGRIGTGVAAGYGLGLMGGAIETFRSKEWKEIVENSRKARKAGAGDAGKAGVLKWSKLLTDTNKTGTKWAQGFGSIVFLFSAIDWALGTDLWNKPHFKHEELSALTSGALTGAIYRMPTMNPVKIAQASGVGFLCALGYVWLTMDEVKRRSIFESPF